MNVVLISTALFRHSMKSHQQPLRPRHPRVTPKMQKRMTGRMLVIQRVGQDIPPKWFRQKKTLPYLRTLFLLPMRRKGQRSPTQPNLPKEPARIKLRVLCTSCRCVWYSSRFFLRCLTFWIYQVLDNTASSAPDPCAKDDVAPTLISSQQTPNEGADAASESPVAVLDESVDTGPVETRRDPGASIDAGRSERDATVPPGTPERTFHHVKDPPVANADEAWSDSESSEDDENDREMPYYELEIHERRCEEGNSIQVRSSGLFITHSLTSP
jgi:hypothetical protein